MDGLRVGQKHNAQNATPGGGNTPPAPEASIALELLPFGEAGGGEDPFLEDRGPIGAETHMAEIGGTLHRARAAGSASAPREAPVG